MSTQYLFISGVFLSSLLTGCMTSENWIDDDVYVLKSAEIPVDTDITDETDYNAFVYNQNRNTRTNHYYSDFYGRPSFMMGFGGMYNYMGYTSGYYRNYGWGGYNNGFYDPYYSPFYNPYYGYGNPYYNPYYGYSGSPYCGWGNPYYAGGGYGNGSGNPGPIKPTGIHYKGPRGSSSGIGGVSSRSTVALRSAPVPSAGRGQMVTSQQAAASERTLTAKPVTTNASVGRTNGRVITTPQSAAGNTGTISRGQLSKEPARPASTTVVRNGAGSVGRVSSPQRSSSGGTVNSGNPSRGNQGTISSPPPRSNGGSTGGTRSGSGGVKPSGRR